MSHFENIIIYYFLKVLEQRGFWGLGSLLETDADVGIMVDLGRDLRKGL